MKVAFIDRDGTIIKEYPDEEWRYVTEPILLKDSLEGIIGIRKKGYEIIIVTNQYLINEGIITLSQYKTFTESLIQELVRNGITILDVFYCPHSRDENCDCIKPKTGLIDMALERYSEIELSKSFVAGDSMCDVELGHKLGIRTFGINIKLQLENYISVESLLDIVKYL